MTGKFILLILFCCGQVGFAQKVVKKNLYLFFTPDSPNYLYSRAQKAITIKGVNYPDEADIYGTTYKSKDGAKRIRHSYFITINKNRYQVTDSIGFKALKPTLYQNLPKIKGADVDTSDKLRFPYKNVYVIEKLADNRFKIVQVSSYIGSDNIIYFPGINM